MAHIPLVLAAGDSAINFILLNGPFPEQMS